MSELLSHLKQRKLVQWALAYLAAACVLLQIPGPDGGGHDVPHGITRMAFAVAPAWIGYVIDQET